MKKFNLCILILLISTVNAQEQSILISYAGKFNSLFGRGEDFRPYKASLYIQGDQSVFTMKPLNASPERENIIDLEMDSLFTVYKDIESNSLLFEFMDLDKRSHYFADTLYPMHWIITNERKNINGISCIKAFTTYKGRNYIGWYDSSLQISNGPWKLGGLPGMIMEAYDTDQQWHLVVNGISYEKNIDLSYHKNMLTKPIKGYAEFSSHLKKLFSSIEGMMTAQPSDDCMTCEMKSQLKINTWEPIY